MNDMNGLINSDPFCIEPFHSTEELSTIVNTKNVVENPLIASYNSRYQGTNLLDFFHGRCLRFQNFVFSVKICSSVSLVLFFTRRCVS